MRCFGATIDCRFSKRTSPRCRGKETAVPAIQSAPPPRLSAELSLRIYDLMLRTRILEERLIAMYKQGDGFFCIGGPGEEAFNVPLGLLVNKGMGPDHDYLHLHYRSN